MCVFGKQCLMKGLCMCKCTLYLCVKICHYDDVQVHVCNNASVCTSVSQHERMHFHALCDIVGMLQKNSNPTNRNKNSTVKKSVKNKT